MASSEQLESLAAALSKAQAEFPAISKDANNPFFKSKYADLATVIKMASPVLTKNGLSVAQFIGYDDGGDTLTTWLMHASGQFINQTMRLHLSKHDAQGQGSATTYARRYSYMAVLGLVADEDDDGNAASSQGAKSYPKRDYTPPAAPVQVVSEEPPAPNPDTPNPKARQTPNKAKFDELTHAFNSIYMTENVKKIDFIRGILGHPMPNNDEEVDRIIKAIEEKK